MCYEFWRQDRSSAEEDRAKRAALELIKKAKVARKPATERASPVHQDEKETELAPV
jgi:hypothetical protein